MIVTLTMNPCIDVSADVDSVVADHKLRCGVPRYEPGGGGLNVSRALQRIGGTSTAVYPSGGPFGEHLQAMLTQERLEHVPVSVAGLTRQNLTIYERSTGEQYRFTLPGARLAQTEWERVLDTFEPLAARAHYVVASGSLPPGVPDDFYARLFRRVNRAACRTILDTSGEALARGVEEGCYLIKPNLRELSQLAKGGDEFESEEEMERAARSLVEHGRCEVVLVSLGAAGVLLTTSKGSERIRTPTVPIRSKVGAGDSLVAGTCYALAQGKSIREAARFGVAAGSAAVMTPGTELCRREDVFRLFEILQREA